MCRRDELESWQAIGPLAYEILEKVGGARSTPRPTDAAVRSAGAHTRLAANDNGPGGASRLPITVGNEKGAGTEATRASWPNREEDVRQGTCKPAAAGG